jgi:hypothetical protein
MLPLVFEALFQAQVVILGLQVKVSIIWKGHKKRYKKFFGGFSIHLLVLFSIVVECSKWFSLWNFIFLSFNTNHKHNLSKTYGSPQLSLHIQKTTLVGVKSSHGAVTKNTL